MNRLNSFVVMDTQLLVGCLLLFPLVMSSVVATADATATVDIVGGPLISVALGEPLNLTCVVQGPPSDHQGPIAWLQDGDVVMSGASAQVQMESRADGSRRSSLVKQMAERSDAGEYACVVRGGGQASTTVRVVQLESSPVAAVPSEEGGVGHEASEHVASDGAPSAMLSVEHVAADDAPSAMLSHPPGGCVNAATGAILANGDEWREDPCTTCRCEHGRKKCQAYMCRATCSHPKRVAGECCPVCEGTSVVTLPSHCPSLAHCSLRCPHGFVKDQDGCFRCLCQAASTTTTDEPCRLECPHGVARGASGQPLCECAPPPCAPLLCAKNCSHGLHANRLGCPVCKCHKCKRMVFASPTPGHSTGNALGALIKSTSHGVLLLCPGPCPHGHASDERGCPTCWCNEPPNSSEGMTHIHGEGATKEAMPCTSTDGSRRSADEVWWNGGCRRCGCVDGVERCGTIEEPSCTQSQQATPCTNHDAASSSSVVIDCCPGACAHREPVSLIALSVLCALVLLVLVVIAVRARHFVWWPGRGATGCLRFAEDGGVRVLGVASATDAHAAPKYDLQPMGAGVGCGKAVVRRSAGDYESVPRYEQTCDDKSALAPL